ncbi:LytR/AlgR family response regulator transcription factor [Flavihumibacter solisilvae]|uniref:LytR/AlgR family response regulator transcription factor n=1 Tax=Flavihumibacter solisilvae TaxID=1349421 RepID=UPI001364E1F9|nr:LytTR family DNA-binding domain-containing protein [Flavihumibacter solisilvae]
MESLAKSHYDTYGEHAVQEGSKTSFLVYKNHTYRTIPTESVAYFTLKFGGIVLVAMDGKEYTLNYSLEHIQHLVSSRQFFRLNRQYLVNFSAVAEAEHYFARKLLVKLIIPTTEKLLVSKEKASSFLHWLENR